MNARAHVLELTVDERQISETVLSIFHSLMFHRTLGKFHYKQEGSYSIGTLGMVDVDCDYIDFTYVRVASDELDNMLKKEVSGFQDDLRRRFSGTGGAISLEFYQKRKSHLFKKDDVPWEVWTIVLEVVKLNNENDRQQIREKVGELLTEKVFYIAETMSKFEYIPKVPNEPDLELVFDLSFPNIQPYLFRQQHHQQLQQQQLSTSPSSSSSSSPSAVGSVMKKIIKGALAI
ncbi:hypothetical protein HELRODRAFT_157054 [Helobdella robusta]|uniref:Autophagy-related protein 101 n=1 Tax=Helobdella robusta TaxID=6412 RepID=T1EM55_HELRO|nr:hypothetical protein HELRODRAFT_157054 [Helobdella robusta]ESO03582.1 hypothetical protein HELRODRAFT_157054 [Helobdella robusta]